VSTPSAAVRTRGPDLAGYLFAGLGACLFATKGVIIKLAYQTGLTAETLLTLRLLIAAPVYAAIGIAAVRRGRALPSAVVTLKAMLVGALGYWLASYTDFEGLNYISVQFERLILFTYPAFVVLFGAALFGQKVRPAALWGVALSYAGLFLMFGTKLQAFGSAVTRGALLVLTAAVAFAFYQLLAKDLIGRLGSRLFTCIAMLGAMAATLAQFVLTRPLSDLQVSHAQLGYALFLAAGATIAPTFLLNAALERISPQANGAIGTLSPVVTLVLAAAVLGERITAVDITATALVIAGVAWFTLVDSRRKAG
jgi:drug/metabolite transporter (DMT)-like permease